MTFDNPFLGGAPQGFVQPNPPVMPQRNNPMLGGQMNPALLAGIQHFTDGLAAQRAMPQPGPAMPPPAAPPPMAAPPQHHFPFEDLIRQAAMAKFHQGLATPLADRLGWSAGWGQRGAPPVGMAQPPVLPAQPPMPQNFMAPAGGSGGFGSPMSMSFADAANQSQIGMNNSASKNQNIGSNPGY